MPSSPYSRRLRRTAWTVAATLGFAIAAFVSPSPAEAAAQPVTVVTSVDGVVGAPTYTGVPTTVSFAVTNRSTQGAKLDAFSIVVPPGVTGVTRAGVFGPGNWNETILRCGSLHNCSAIVLVTAGLPFRSSAVPPGGTVAASINFKAPGTPGTLNFPMIGIGNGIFTVSGPTPSVTVLDGAVAKFGVVVTPPVVAGSATNVVVTALNAANHAVPFIGGPVTVNITGDDAAATVRGTPFGSGNSVVLNISSTSTGVFGLSSVFTKAQAQTVMVHAGSLAGTSNVFTVLSAAPKSVQITSIADTSQNPALPTPAANQTFAVGFTAFDSFGNVATQAGVPVTLSAVNPAGGTLSPPVPTGSTGANGTGTISATYSVAQTGLQLQVSSPGLTPGTGTTDVVSAGDSSNGTPGTGEELAAGNATADLPNGSFGPVFLTTAPCSDESCQQGVEITLDGTFTNGDSHLYTDDAPGTVSTTCPNEQCPHPDAEPEGEEYVSPPADIDDQEQAEDFFAYPVQVSLKVDGVYQPFQTAPPCRDLSLERMPGEDTGQIVYGPAMTAGFCVDVFAISRTGDSFTGDLTLPVLFVEDPKLRPS